MLILFPMCITRSKSAFFWLVFTGIFIFNIGVVSAQVSLLDTRISGDYRDQSLKEILDDMEDKTGIHFSYSPKKIPVEEKITFVSDNLPLHEVLMIISRKLPVKYEVVDNYVILKYMRRTE